MAPRAEGINPANYYFFLYQHLLLFPVFFVFKKCVDGIAEKRFPDSFDLIFFIFIFFKYRSWLLF